MINYRKHYARYPYTDDEGSTHVFRGSLKEYTALHERIRITASAHGCRPFWYDGMIGWGWHCGCKNLRHACNQQCSAITVKSAAYGECTQYVD